MQTKLRHALPFTLPILLIFIMTLANCGDADEAYAVAPNQAPSSAYQTQIMEISEVVDGRAEGPTATTFASPLDRRARHDRQADLAMRSWNQPKYGRIHEFPSLPIGYPQLLLVPHAAPLSLPDPNHVYAPETETVDQNGPDQGQNGDCWLNATLAALAYRHPMAIKDAIRDTEDPNLWQVRLFELTTRRPVYLYVRREYFINEPLADRVVNDIKWPAIIQNAIVQFNDATGQIKGGVHGYAGLNSNHADVAFNLLLNGGAWGEWVSKYNNDGAIRTRLGSGYPLVITTNVPPAELGLVAHHSYTVLDVDQATGNVSFRNPWGIGSVDGHGKVILSAADARRAFDIIYFSWPP